MGATSGPGSVVRSVKASPAPSGIGRQRPAKQNQSSPGFVNFHFDFGDFVPVNSKKCDAGMRQRPFGNRLLIPAMSPGHSEIMSRGVPI
jgi:hypothetical protein